MRDSAYRSQGATRWLLLPAVLALAALAPLPAHAQAPAAGQWIPWLGCWQPVADGAQPTHAPQLCIHATPGTPGVAFATVADGQVVAEHQMIADGARHDLAEAGCHGWQSAMWSEDGHRLYRRSQLDCDGGGSRSTSGVLLFLTPDRWVDIEAAGGPGQASGVRAQRYELVAPGAAAAANLLPRGMDLALETGRTAAAAPLRVADVIDASHRLAPDVVQSMVFERHNGYTLDATSLTELADAGVSGNVIDLMVALTYPNRFAIDSQNETLALRSDSTRPRGGGGPGPGWGGWGCYTYDYGMYPFPGWSGLGFYGPYYRMNPYFMYGYGSSIYAYDPCYPYGGYGPYGGGYGWGGYGWGGFYPSGGVVVTREPSGNGGRAVRGHGYEPPNGSTAGSTGRTAHPRGGSEASPPSAGTGRTGGSSAQPATGSSGSGSSGSGSSGGYQGGGTPTGRTAHPRNQSVLPTYGAPYYHVNVGSPAQPAAQPVRMPAPRPAPSFGAGRSVYSAPARSSSPSSAPAVSRSSGGYQGGGTYTGRTAHPR